MINLKSCGLLLGLEAMLSELKREHAKRVLSQARRNEHFLVGRRRLYLGEVHVLRASSLPRFWVETFGEDCL